MAWKAGGVDFVHDVIEMQFAGRVGQKANAPVYYYVICLLGAAGPWLFWCLPALTRFLRRLRGGGRLSQLRKSMPVHPVSRLALMWFLGVLIIFTVASTKHSRYILPLFPALAIMLAISVNRVVDQRKPSLIQPWNLILLSLPPMLAIAAGGFLVFFRQNGITASVLTAAWTGAVLAGWFAIRKMTRKELRLVASIVLALVTGLSGFDLVARPIVSQKASGKSFVKASEGLVNEHYPVAIYGLGSDGDGAKYALYSSRRPETLHFVSHIEAIRGLPRPCLLIASEGDSPKLQAALQKAKHHLLTKGFIRSKAVAAYILE